MNLNRFLVIFSVVPLFLTGCRDMYNDAMTSHQENRANYNQYIISTEQINTVREEHDLQPYPILTYAQWSGGTGALFTSVSTNQPIQKP